MDHGLVCRGAWGEARRHEAGGGLLHARPPARPCESGKPRSASVEHSHAAQARQRRPVSLRTLGPASAIATKTREAAAQTAAASRDRPNILVIRADDICIANISAYKMGLMGYQTPNIDRIAMEGMIFTDYCGEQSCTAGRFSFIMGQSVFRTVLSKVGLPGVALSMREEDPTIAGLLKGQGYATGQIGKNHLRDRDEHLPTNHGFDVFFGE